jgi:uncharacterized protein YndB with AHSA1/START domain
MTQAATETRSVVIEREIPHPPEKIWRALTEPHLIAEWLMKNDFEPVANHKFNLRGDWGGVDCQVLKIDPPRTLSYSWAANGLESVVTWSLTPTSKGGQPACGAAGLPCRSGAVLSRGEDGMGELLRQTGGGVGADRLIAARRASSP